MFGANLAEAQLDTLVRGQQWTPSDPTPLEFVWLWLADADGGRRLGEALDAGFAQGAWTEAICLPVVTFWFGGIDKSAPSEKQRLQLVGEFERRFGSAAKAVHGCLSARLGNVGSSRRISFGVITAERSALLTALCEKRFGDYIAYAKTG